MSVWIIQQKVLTLQCKRKNQRTMHNTNNTNEQGEREQFVAYIRVSTRKQGASGLGLDAQRETIAQTIRLHGGEQIAEYKDVESGTHRNREGLREALAHCKRTGATLIIAKLDRLARDVEFIFSVVNTGAKILFADMPLINTVTLGVFASVAQYERELISERTRKALAQKRARGAQLGTPTNLTAEATAKGQAVRRRRAEQRGAQYIEYIHIWREQGATLQAIADKLNGKGFTTPRGGAFTRSTVQMYLNRK